MRTISLAILVAALGVAGCAAGSPETKPSARASIARPAPGIDIAAPPATPQPGLHPRPRGEPLDLGADRVAAAVRVPSVPPGGSLTFSFPDANGGADRLGWVARLPERSQLPSVAYGDGRVYVSGGFDTVSFYALDSEDGRLVWASRHLEDNGPTAPIYEEDRVIFNTESCTLFVMDARTGRKLWHKYLGDPTLAQPAVSDGLIYAQHPGATHTGFALSAYRVRNGAKVWTRAVSGELLAAPVVAGDSVYAATIHGRLYRFDRKSGARRWSVGIRATSAPWVQGEELFLARRRRGREEQIVVSAADGSVLRVHRSVAGGYLKDVPRDMNDWKKVWVYEGSRPVIAGGTVYEAMGGLIQASDPGTGESRWTRRNPGDEDERSVGSVAVAGPQVVIATRRGKLYGLDVDTGYTLWAYDVGKPIVAQPIVARGWVYATSTDGTIVALELGDTSLDGWHMWGGNPHHNGPVARGG